MAFEGISSKLQSIFKKLTGKGRLSEKEVRESMREIKLALLECGVAAFNHPVERGDGLLDVALICDKLVELAGEFRYLAVMFLLTCAVADTFFILDSIHITTYTVYLCTDFSTQNVAAIAGLDGNNLLVNFSKFFLGLFSLLLNGFVV